MKLTSLVSIASLVGASLAEFATAQQLSGAGATFPAPLYQRWAVEYNKLHSAVQVNYQAVGSGAGVKQFMQGTVDFGASDAAMSDEEIAKVKQGAVMIPATAGSIVVAYNLPNVADLKLSREALAGIFLGTVKKWNDPAIAKDNSGVNLPDLPINVAVRSDGSGTTFVFTKHLAAISQDFADEVGIDKSVTWPVGAGGKGNEGVTALIKQSPGTIGYVEYWLCSEQRPLDGKFAKQEREICQTQRRKRRGHAGQCHVPRKLAGLARRPHGRRRLPHCHLHLAPALQEVSRRCKAQGA